MFHLSERLSLSRSATTDSGRYLKRAGLFAAGLVLLWLALQLLPDSLGSTEPPVYSDDAGTVAARTDAVTASRGPSLMTPGNAIAVLLLGGGVALAVYLRRRSGDEASASALTSVGELAMGPNQSVRLVACAGEVLLLGVAGGQITLLKSYDADRFETADEAVLEAGGSHFGDLLRQYAAPHVKVEKNGSAC